MALKLPDSAVPMGDFPVAKAVDIDFDDGKNLQEKFDNGELGGGGRTIMYTSLEALGLTAPVSVGEIFNAMPDKTMAVIACEGKEGNTDGAGVHVSDVPVSYGVLTIKKNEKGRFSIEYQNSLQGSPCDVKRWIGTLKGEDGTGLYWKQISTEPTFVTLNDIGLTADATFQDVIDALPKGGSALLGVKDFTNYQTIFPYEDGSDQFARAYIVKGAADGSCMYARWFRKDGSKEAIAIFNRNDNKFTGWQEKVGITVKRYTTSVYSSSVSNYTKLEETSKKRIILNAYYDYDANVVVSAFFPKNDQLRWKIVSGNTSEGHNVVIEYGEISN